MPPTHNSSAPGEPRFCPKFLRYAWCPNLPLTLTFCVFVWGLGPVSWSVLLCIPMLVACLVCVDTPHWVSHLLLLLNLACRPSSTRTWLNLQFKVNPLHWLVGCPPAWVCPLQSLLSCSWPVSTQLGAAIPLEALAYQLELKPWVTHCPWYFSSASASSSKLSLLSLWLSGSWRNELPHPTSRPNLHTSPPQLF